ITVRNSTLSEINGGIELNSVHNCHIEDITAIDNAHGIYSYFSSNTTIVDSTLSSNRWGSIYLHFSIDITLINTVMMGEGISISGLSLAHWNTHTIDTSNTVNGKPVYYWKNVIGGTIPLDAGQIILANCTGAVVESQVIVEKSAAILLAFSLYNRMANNTVSNNRQGIYLHFSANNTIVSNTFSSKNTDGISLYHSDNNTVINNEISSNAVGIDLSYSNHNTIANNTISLNTWGVSLSDSSYNTITDNTISSNEQGFTVGGSNDNTIINNTVSDNWYGISITYSHGNRIYRNKFLDNERQADDNTNDNQWDNGYPSGGNYWSDYSCVDEKSGPNQDRAGSDGICDTPYNIHGGVGKDRYPLSAPSEERESVWFWAVIAVVMVILLVLLVLIRRRK
ncbi:MAG: right-handed parallel beta-helix repeat-containing protein, partial [Thermoplasmata archaeon]|nr:right-handed parallel beta-helix repeat-containing protein [Thermoplasmata archaeon]